MLNGNIKKHKLILILFLLLCIFVSCKVVNFLAIEIDISIPVDASTFEEEGIYITLNLPPKKNNFENIVSLEEKGTSTDLTFDWESDRKVKITPTHGWRCGRSYMFKIRGELITEGEGDFDVNELRYFAYGNAEQQLFLTSFPEGMLTPEVKKLVFKFNEPIIQTSFISNISFNPYFENTITFSEDNTTVYVTPKDDWMINKIINWTLTDDVKSVKGFFIDRGYEGDLLTIEDNELPKLLKVCPTSLKSDGKYTLLDKELNKIIDKQGIGFVFSKPMDFSSVEKNINFSPSIVGKFLISDEEKKVFVFQPYSKYDIDTLYHITVSSSCADTKKLKLFEDEDIFFKAANQFLKVESIKLNDLELIGQSEMQTVKGLGEDKENKTVIMEIRFSATIEDKKLADDSIQCSSIFPASLSSPIKESVLWKNGNIMTIKYTRFTSPALEELNHYYKINIIGTSGGIISANDDYMEENLCIEFMLR